jgi:anthranilate phosphoribosyltransferase
MIVTIIQSVAEGHSLSRAMASDLMESILTGSVSPAQFGALVTALRMKGETADEIAGFADTMRQHATRVDLGKTSAVDNCGTGGDGVAWFNVSTTAAFIAAGAGAKVAKHGNRSASSQSGGADVLEALGIRVAVAPEVVAESVHHAGVGFMFAQTYHPGMKFAAPLRREIGIRTVFNILGPLTNPAGVKRQLLGVADASLAPLMASALQQMGAEHALIVSGHGGVDEITLDGPTEVTEIREGELRSYTLTANELGLPVADREALAGGTPAENAIITREILNGCDAGPKRNVAVANAAGALLASGVATSWREGTERAATAISNGSAMKSLERMIAVTNGP